MKIRLPALLTLCMLVFAGTAGALTIDEEFVAVTAMPLAVADVAALPEVPQNDLMTLIATLNQALVPAPQFVEIVRYVPVALVQPAEPRFVTYVTQEYQRGITGEPLAVAIADRYSAYGIEDVDIADPPVLTVVERREILPQVVVTRFRPVEFDPLALIAMPLAVAAAADIAGVPQNDLMRLVASLNQALVPAPQFVEVVRYSPVVLVDQTAAPQFIQFIDTEIDRGIIGRPLAFAIADRIETFEPVEINIASPVLQPERIVTRTARAHPHGGPPGQVKKQLGLQTGAEVVHRTARPKPARVTRARKQRTVAPVVVQPRPERVRPEKVRAEKVQGNPGRGNSGGGQGQGKAHGQGKGKGKGKG